MEHLLSNKQSIFWQQTSFLKWDNPSITHHQFGSAIKPTPIKFNACIHNHSDILEACSNNNNNNINQTSHLLLFITRWNLGNLKPVFCYFRVNLMLKCFLKIIYPKYVLFSLDLFYKLWFGVYSRVNTQKGSYKPDASVNL